MSEICRVRLCCGFFADGCDSRGALVSEVGAEETTTRSRRGGGAYQPVLVAWTKISDEMYIQHLGDR